MSSTHTAAVWALQGNIGATARLVLLCLADHAAYNGRAEMSLPQIADCCGLSVRSVQRVIGALFQAELIDVLESGMGNGKTPVYAVLTTTRSAAIADNRGARKHIETREARLITSVSHETGQILREASQDEAETADTNRLETRQNSKHDNYAHEIPAGLQADPGPQPARDLNTAAGAPDGRQVPGGAEGLVPAPVDAPAPPVAGGGVPYEEEPLQPPYEINREPHPFWDNKSASHHEIYRVDPMPPLPKPARMIPHFLPPNDVGRILMAAGAELGDLETLYWWRSEHKAELATLLSGLGLTVERAIAAIEENGRKVPGIRRIADLEPLIRG